MPGFPVLGWRYIRLSSPQPARIHTSLAYDLFYVHHRENAHLRAPGGARVVYYSQLSEGVIALLMAYTKAKFDNLPPAFLLQLKKEFEDA